MKPSEHEEGKIVFMRVSNELLIQLEQLKERLHSRGISTVIRQIVETALKEGINVTGEPRQEPAERMYEEKPARKTKRAA